MAEAKVVKGPMGRGHRGPKPKVENPGLIFKRVMSYVGKKYKLHCFVVLICIVVNVLSNIQGTLFTMTLIDDHITPMLKSGIEDYSGLLKAMLRVAVFYGCGILASFTQGLLMAYVTQGTMKDLRIDMYRHMESLPIKYFDTHAHGDIMSMYTNDIDTLRQMISQSIPQFINSIITVVSVLISMITLNIPLTVLTILMVAVMLSVSGKVVGNSGKYFVKQQQDLGAVNGFIEEMMEGQKVVKVFCHEDESREKFKELNEKLYDSAKNANTYVNMMGPINGQLGHISYVLCAIAGGMLALKNVGGFTLGGLASFLTFNRNFSMPINQISQQMNAVVMGLAGADRKPQHTA